jgi:hypothetical protein
MNELSRGSLLSLGIFLFIVIGILVTVAYLERNE